MIEAEEIALDGSYNYAEALERQNLKHEDVVRLREAVSDSKYVPRFIIDKQLLLFLNATGDVEESAKMLESYYKCKKETPEFFNNRDVLSKEIQGSFRNQAYVALPVTPDNYSMIFHRLTSFETQDYVFDDAVKTFIIAAEGDAYINGPRDGAIYVFDLTGVRFGHIFRPSVNSLRKGIRFLEDGNPYDIKAIHILNGVSFFDMILGLLRPFVRSTLLSKIHFHSPNMDYERFYREHIPRSHLPSDFGGDLESVEVLHERYCKTLTSLREYFLYEENQVNSSLYDESYENTKM